MQLNRDKAAAPLYSQLEKIIRYQIENGEYAYGDLYPSEKQLQEEYDVSRVTVRQAISTLVNAGYLECSRGKGTTVVFNKINEQIKQVISFSEEMQQHGITMSTSYCEVTVLPAVRTVAAALDVGEGTRVYCVERVRCAEDTPIVYSATYLAPVARLSLDPSYYMESLYHYLKSTFDIQITRGKDTFEASLASEEVALFLGISVGSPVFKRTRATMDQNNRNVEFTICYYPGDRYKYTVEL